MNKCCALLLMAATSLCLAACEPYDYDPDEGYHRPPPPREHYDNRRDHELRERERAVRQREADVRAAQRRNDEVRRAQDQRRREEARHAQDQRRREEARHAQEQRRHDEARKRLDDRKKDSARKHDNSPWQDRPQNGQRPERSREQRPDARQHGGPRG